jgi:hypothetical protein
MYLLTHHHQVYRLCRSYAKVSQYEHTPTLVRILTRLIKLLPRVMFLLTHHHQVYRLCPLDSSLPLEKMSDKSIFVAMAIVNIEQIAPNLILQLALLSSYMKNPNQVTGTSFD